MYKNKYNMLRRSVRLSRIRRLALKEKIKNEEIMRKKGNNYPVNIDKLKDFRKKVDKSYPFFL